MTAIFRLSGMMTDHRCKVFCVEGCAGTLFWNETRDDLQHTFKISCGGGGVEVGDGAMHHVVLYLCSFPRTQTRPNQIRELFAGADKFLVQFLPWTQPGKNDGEFARKLTFPPDQIIGQVHNFCWLYRPGDQYLR